MKRRAPKRPASSAARQPPARESRLTGWLAHHERALVASLLALHAALVVWGAAVNSVTFDENFHLPSGVVAVTEGRFTISPVNPPLVKVLCALPALAIGAVPPDTAAVRSGSQAEVGESFMRRNAAHYHTLFLAARLVVLMLSLALGLLVWRFARRLHGPAGGVLALGFYALAPEALAHGGLATLDVATGLGFTATVYAFWRFTRTGRWADWILAVLALGTFALARFTALLAFPMLALLLLVHAARRHLHRPGRAWLGLGLLVPATMLALQVGYLGQTSLRPLDRAHFFSARLRSLQRAAPWLRLPLPDAWLEGLDFQTRDSEAGGTPTFLFGRERFEPIWYYFPLALLFKWPLGFLGALAHRGLRLGLGRDPPRRHQDWVLLPGLMFLLASMFLVQLNAGVRYVFPLLPLGCVWVGGLLRRAPRAPASAAHVRVALAWLVLAGIEAGACAPWYLTFFNWPSGGPGGGYRLVNDSNVDWGQGLIALRDEMRRRGIERIHLAYHGTTDPAIYGIDYVPYFGGTPGPESDWIAISSYYFVGQEQRMMTQRGRTPPVAFDFRGLWNVAPAASPARCMYLFPVPRPAGPRGPGGP